MKKKICLITAFALSGIMTFNVSAAVTSVSDTRTETKALTNLSTKVNKEQGVIDENGAALNVSKASPEAYTFESGDYTYSLLDKDSDGNYFILAADRYGKFDMGKPSVNNIFDPTPAETNSDYSEDVNVAIYLNGEFFDGTASMTSNKSMTVFDAGIKSYIVPHDWIIEGNGQDADESVHLTSVTKNDFKVNCKIALLSWSEYIKYSDKIGYASTQYVNNNLTATTTMLLRSPNSGKTNLYHVQEKSGNISSSINMTTTQAPDSAYLRPCFYVSREYFKNVRIKNYGSDVKRMLKEDFTEAELKAAGYPDEEVADIKGEPEPVIKSGFVMTDDMENGVSDWVVKAMTDYEPSVQAVAYPDGSTDNKAMKIGYNTYTYLKLQEDAASGILTVEADVCINGGNFGVGIVESGYQNMQGKLYPLFVGNGQTKISAIINRSAGSYNVSDTTIASYYLDDDGANITTKNNAMVHLKLIINADTGECAVMANNKLSGVIDIPYLGTAKGQKAIGAIAFMNRKATDVVAYVDNVKICYDPKGSVISEAVAGSGKAAFTLRGGTDAPDLTAEDIVLKDHTGQELAVMGASVNGNSVIIETSDAFSVGKTYIVSVPSLSSEYPITEKRFKYLGESFAAAAEITAENYAVGETAAAACTIQTSVFTSKKVILYLAAYSGGRLVGVTSKEIDITENDFGKITDTAELTLKENADCIRAFVWNENQLPYDKCAEKTKAN